MRQGALSSSPLPSPSQLLGGSEPLDGRNHDTLMIVNAAQRGDSVPSEFCKAQSEYGKSPVKKDQFGVLGAPSPKESKICQRSSRKMEKEAYETPMFRRPPVLESDEDEPVVESKYFKSAAAPPPEVEASDVLPPKKTRRKKGQKGELQQRKIKKPSITKPGSIKDITKTKKFGPPKRAKEDRSPERLLSNAVAEKKAKLTPEELANLGLEEASIRKTDWTPVKDRTAPASPPASPLANTVGTISQDAQFGNILSGYGYVEQDGHIVTGKEITSIQPEVGAAKKRKIDLVSGISGGPSTVKVPTVKAAKTKVQTITAKATEGFVVQDEGAMRTLNEFFMPPPKIILGIKKKPRQAAKNANPKSKTKKPSEKAPVVLSPETAMKATRDQAFVFGTSSQLVREESPTCIREIQKVVKMSEAMNEQTPHEPQTLFANIRASSSIGLTPTRSLWSAAARNDGSVLEAEYMILEDTPQPMKVGDMSARPVNDAEPVKDLRLDEISQVTKETSETVKITDIEPLPTSVPLSEDTQQSLPRSMAEKAVKPRTKSASPKKKPAIKSTTGDMPNFQGFTDIQLSKEVKSFGFKKIKSRTAMITLLEKCWENQKSKALQELASNTLIPQPCATDAAVVVEQPSKDIPNKPKPQKKAGRPPKNKPADTTSEPQPDPPPDAPPKKKRGRPKKDPSSPIVPAKRKAKPQPQNDPPPDEIYDSDPPTPSPPRRRNPPKPTPSLPLSPSRAHLPVPASKAAPSPTDLARLHSAITLAITSQPPTHDIASPSWHERILMYDPIVIEDLAAWLNSEEGLAKVMPSEDDQRGGKMTVTTGVVKEWCEGRSVCCLWRENLRGGVRARW